MESGITLSVIPLSIVVSIRTKTGSDSHPNPATGSRLKTATQQRRQMDESSVGLSSCSRPKPASQSFTGSGVGNCAAQPLGAAAAELNVGHCSRWLKNGYRQQVDARCAEIGSRGQIA